MIRLLATTSLAALLFACNADDPAILPVDGPSIQDGTVQGRMQGDMPLVGDFEEQASTGYGYKSDDWLELTLHSNGDYGWAMIGVWASVDAQTGEVVVEPGSVIGCTGPDEGYAEFDEPAEDVHIDVDPVVIDGEEFVEVDVEATFADGSVVTAVAVVPVGTPTYGYGDEDGVVAF